MYVCIFPSRLKYLHIKTQKPKYFLVASICHIYYFTPEDLRFKWEAFNSLGHNLPTVKHLKQLRNEIEREKKNNAQSRQKTSTPTFDKASIGTL